MIVVLCGLPGVGKTTVAERLRDRLHQRGHSVRVLDSDEFSWNTYERMYERVANSAADWIVAGTFYKCRWQERFLDLENVNFVYLAADLETCLERNRWRASPIEEAAVHIVWREFEEPDADLTIDVGERSPEAVVARILADVFDEGV